MTTRIFTLITGCRATRENNFLTFSLKELRPDEDGEVVIDDQIGTDVTVLTDDPVIDRGIEEDHITRPATMSQALPIAALPAASRCFTHARIALRQRERAGLLRRLPGEGPGRD